MRECEHCQGKGLVDLGMSGSHEKEQIVGHITGEQLDRAMDDLLYVLADARGEENVVPVRKVIDQLGYATWLHGSRDYKARQVRYVKEKVVALRHIPVVQHARGYFIARTPAEVYQAIERHNALSRGAARMVRLLHPLALKLDEGYVG